MDLALERCGFTTETATHLIAQGFDAPERLLLASEEDIDSLARTVNRNAPAPNVSMPFLATKGLKGFRFWADECRRTGYLMDPDSFGDDDVVDYARHMDEHHTAKSAASDEDVAKPSALKKLNGWITWKESLMNYLQGIIGAARIPLTYLIREEEDPPADGTPEADEAHYANHTDYLTSVTLLDGNHFTLDNTRFYRDLKSLLIDGDGWDFIKRYERTQNGRAAYRTLLAQCEGVASKIARKNRAYARIGSAAYKGHNRKFTFEDYVAVHQSAHNEVYDCDPTEAIPESKKVTDFLKGIEDDKMEPAVSVVLGDPRLLNDFNACQQYLSTTVMNRLSLSGARPGQRGVSSTSTEKNGGRRGGAGKKLPKNFKLEDKWYPPSIFKLLSKEQKDQLTKWQETKEKRKVAALKREIIEELKGEDSDDDDDVSDDDDAAGTQFGRRVHTKDKKAKKKQKK